MDKSSTRVVMVVYAAHFNVGMYLCSWKWGLLLL